MISNINISLDVPLHVMEKTSRRSILNKNVTFVEFSLPLDEAFQLYMNVTVTAQFREGEHTERIPPMFL
jgi:hypothetical protein